MRQGALGRLRFGQLRLIVEMEEGRSMRSAAARMNMTQPAVSKALKEMETILGMQLYERSANGVRPTPAGEVAARGARLLLGELGMLTEELGYLRAGGRGSVRVGMTPYLGASLLPDMLARMNGNTEVGSVSLEEGLAAPLLAKLSQGALDLLVIMYSQEMLPALENASLRFVRLFDERMAIVGAPGGTRDGKPSVRLTDLAGERWVLPAAPSLTRQRFDEAFLHQGLAPPRPVLEATVITNVLAAASAGVGLAACPWSAADSLCAAGRLRRIALRPGISLPPIGIVHRRLLSDHPRVAALAKALQAELVHNRPSR